MKPLRHSAYIISLFVMLSCSGPTSGEMAASGDWEGIIRESGESGGRMRIIDVCFQNLALAETGRLADEAFRFTQSGASGILPDWDWDTVTGMLLSDLYYSMGHIALAQKLAFEANVCSTKAYEPAAIRRLVQTNIIYGAWEVAEKYISLLEKDRKYSSWATAQRRFLGDERAVLDDSEYGPRKKCIPAEDFVTGSKASDEDLKIIIRTNPEYGKTIEYLGVKYLAECDFENFKSLIDEFYGTPALQELPVSFAEAACMLSELEPGYWKKAGVDSGVYRKFRDFNSRLEAGLPLDRYSETYWYYVKNIFDK